VQKGRAIKAQSFQSIEAIAVRDFDDKRIILIQVGCFFVSGVVGAITLERSVVCRTFQRLRIRIELSFFLVEREC